MKETFTSRAQRHGATGKPEIPTTEYSCLFHIIEYGGSQDFTTTSKPDALGLIEYSEHKTAGIKRRRMGFKSNAMRSKETVQLNKDQELLLIGARKNQQITAYILQHGDWHWFQKEVNTLIDANYETFTDTRSSKEYKQIIFDDATCKRLQPATMDLDETLWDQICTEAQRFFETL